MLMVDRGWHDQLPGRNGESLLVRWSDAIRLIRSDESGTDIVADLFADVPFPDGAPRSVAYRLTTARGPEDIGIRLKGSLLDFLKASVPGPPRYPRSRAPVGGGRAGRPARRARLG
jgi:hypothetical protein